MVAVVFHEAPIAAVVLGVPAACVVVPDFPRDLAALGGQIFNEETGAWLFNEESGADLYKELR